MVSVGSSGTNIADQHDSRPKRGHGEGNIYRRSDGVWVGRIMLGRSQTDAQTARR